MKLDIIDVVLVGAAVYLFFFTPGFPDEIAPIVLLAIKKRMVKL